MLKNLKDNLDVIYKKTDFNCEIVYQEQLCNIMEFMKDFFPRITKDVDSDLDLIFPGICKKIDAKFDLITQLVFSGLLVAKRDNVYYAFDLSKAPSRTTNDSISEPDNVIGSRDGFVENFKDNIALIRTRVKDENLQIDSLTIGRRSKTIVSVLSIKDIHNQDIRSKLLSTLKKIDIDAILTIDDLMAYFQKKHIFPCYHYIGNPDVACRRLYNGEFLIVIDRICLVVSIPTTFAFSSRFNIDTLNMPIFVGIERLFILIATILSIFFCGILLSFTTIQKDSLSLTILSTLKVTQMGIYMPIFVEIILVLGMFELYYLIGFRQSKITVSSTIVLIGGLIIGQNLISSGLAGVFILTSTALCYLLSFIASSNVNYIIAISITRLFVVFSSLVYGLFGVVVASIILIYYLYQHETLGIKFFYPFLPFNVKGIYKFFLASSDIKMTTRDNLKVKNKIRRKNI